MLINIVHYAKKKTGLLRQNLKCSWERWKPLGICSPNSTGENQLEKIRASLKCLVKTTNVRSLARKNHGSMVESTNSIHVHNLQPWQTPFANIEKIDTICWTTRFQGNHIITQRARNSSERLPKNWRPVAWAKANGGFEHHDVITCDNLWWAT